MLNHTSILAEGDWVKITTGVIFAAIWLLGTIASNIEKKRKERQANGQIPAPDYGEGPVIVIDPSTGGIRYPQTPPPMPASSRPAEVSGRDFDTSSLEPERVGRDTWNRPDPQTERDVRIPQERRGTPNPFQTKPKRNQPKTLKTKSRPQPAPPIVREPVLERVAPPIQGSAGSKTAGISSTPISSSITAGESGANSSAARRSAASESAGNIRVMLTNKGGVKEAFLLSEILGKPKSMS